MTEPLNEPRVFEDRLVRQLEEYSRHAARRPSAAIVARTVAEGVAVRRRPRWRILTDGRPRLFVFGTLLLALSIGVTIAGGGLLDRLTAIAPPISPSPDPGRLATPGPTLTPTPTRPPTAFPTPAPSLPTGTAQPPAFAGSCQGLVQNSSPERLPVPSNYSGAPTAGSLLAVLWPANGGESPDRYVAVVDPQSGAASPESFFGDLRRLWVLPNDGQNLVDWSPDGRYFALHYVGATIYNFEPCTEAFVVSADGNELWQILGRDSNEQFVAWGPDGATWITSATGDAGAAVYLRSLASGDRIALTPPCGGICQLESSGVTWTPGPVTWSPDHDAFAGTGLEVVQGKRRPIIHDSRGWVQAEFTGRSVGWIGDKSVLAVATDPAAPPRLVSWTPGSPGFTDVAPLTVDAESALLSLSPDGRLLAFSDKSAGVGIIDLANDGHVMIVDRRTGDRQAAQLAWSPDSAQLAYVAGSGIRPSAIWTVNADGSDLRLLHGDVFGGLSWQPVWP